MTTHVARRRAGAAVAALAVAVSSLVAGGLANASYAADRTADTDVDTTYLKDTLGLSETDTRVETVTYDRFQWLLQQPGKYVFAVGSPSPAFKTQIQAVDAQAKTTGVTKVYWFDPNLSGYTGAKNLDIRNHNDITSIAPVARDYFGNAWKNVLGQYLGNGYKSVVNGSGKATITADDTVVNDIGAPLWDYRTTPAATPVGASDNVVFVYDKANTDGATPTAKADKILGGVNLTTAADVAASVGTLFTTTTANTALRVDQFKWWQAENNRRLEAQGPKEVFGDKVLTDADGADGWNVQQLTYPELIHLLELKDPADPFKNFALLFGGTWCPNTRAIIKDVNAEAKANGVTVYNWDTILDGGSTGGGNSSADPLQVRNNVDYTTGSGASAVTTPNYVPSFLYGDLVRRHLANVITQYDPNNGNRVRYYPNGDSAGIADVVRKLQVPFLVNYQRTSVLPNAQGNLPDNPSGSAVKRQWIQQNVDPLTGLTTYKEYMSVFWHTHPEGTRLGLINADFPVDPTLPIPTDPLNAPENAFLLPSEQTDPTKTAAEKTALAEARRGNVAKARAGETFGQEAIERLTTFFAGLPGAVRTTQTVVAPKVTYGTAPKVNLSISNVYGRIPAGSATLTVAGKKYVVPVAQNAATFTLPKLPAGSHAFTVKYTKDDAILGFEKTGTVVVAKTRITKSAGASVKVPTTKAAGSYKVTLTTPTGLAKASGKVTVVITKGAVKKSIAGNLSNGIVTVTVPKLAKGTWRVGVVYSGDSNYVPASNAATSIVVTK